MPKDDRGGAPISANKLQFLSQKSAAKLLIPDRPALPEVKAPSLDGISVRVPKPPEVTEQNLIDRLRRRVRAFAKVQNKRAGQKVALGDEVMLDVLAYANGKLIPFSTQVDVWVEVAPDPALPGFYERLVGQSVGTGLRIEQTLPANYPAERWRGAQASFLIDLRAARSVEMPDLEAPATLEKLGLGKTVDQVMAKLAQEAEDELVDRLRLDGINRVLDVLVQRAQVDVPESLIDEEIRRVWSEAERPLLVKKAFSTQEEEAALAAWREDPGLREQARRRLAVSLTIRAVVEKENIQATRPALESMLGGVGRRLGVSAEEAIDALAKDKAVSSEFSHAVLFELGVDFVMRRAQVAYG